jgi:hypothetical protein
MVRPVRNFDGVQHESLRTHKIRGRRFDDIFNEIHDTLEEAYYGDRGEDGRFVPGTGWKDGVSKPFIISGQTFDIQPTLEESKALFDRLHGLLWDRYAVAIHKVNLSLPLSQRIERESYDVHKRDADDNVILWKSDFGQGRLNNAKTNPTQPIDFIDPT